MLFIHENMCENQESKDKDLKVVYISFARFVSILFDLYIIDEANGNKQPNHQIAAITINLQVSVNLIQHIIKATSDL